MKNILFVCTGNTCRSPMAEHLFRKMLDDAGIKDVKVVSAGTAPATWLEFPSEGREALRGLGVTVDKHKAQGLSLELVSQAELILAMEPHHRATILERFPEAQPKTFLLTKQGIADPYGLSLEVYVATLQQIKEALDNILRRTFRVPAD